LKTHFYSLGLAVSVICVQCYQVLLGDVWWKHILTGNYRELKDPVTAERTLLLLLHTTSTYRRDAQIRRLQCKKRFIRRSVTFSSTFYASCQSISDLRQSHTERHTLFKLKIVAITGIIISFCRRRRRCWTAIATCAVFVADI